MPLFGAGKQRSETKQRVLEKMLDYFDRFYDIYEFEWKLPLYSYQIRYIPVYFTHILQFQPFISTKSPATDGRFFIPMHHSQEKYFF